jgi:hypothetical protein
MVQCGVVNDHEELGTTFKVAPLVLENFVDS